VQLSVMGALILGPQHGEVNAAKALNWVGFTEKIVMFRKANLRAR
jgi:hypothetical protein